MTSFISRFGKSTPADEAFHAWTSGDLNRMLKAVEIKTNLIDRHHLLQCIVEATYRQRSKTEMRAKCKEIALIHLKEFPKISAALKEDKGVLPRVSTFQHYSTLLVEESSFQEAIEVCNTALSYGLNDGTKNGFKGRIQRIEKTRDNALK